MTGSPIPLGNTVTYSLWATEGRFGMHVIPRDQLRAGDWIGWSANGRMSDSGGQGGHGMNCNGRYPDGSLATMESNGRNGPCFDRRPLSMATIAVRIDWITPAMVDRMRELTQWCVANRIPYDASTGDNDHDGLTNRADLWSGLVPTRTGVDCTGYNWDQWEYACTHSMPVPPAVPPPVRPSPITSQEFEMPSCYYSPLEQTHRYFHGRGVHAGHIMHSWSARGLAPTGAVLPVESLTAKLNLGMADPSEPIDVMVDPVDLSMAVTFVGADGRLNRLHYTGAQGPWQQQYATAA